MEDMIHEAHTIMLDAFYMLKVKEKEGKLSGEVIRQDGRVPHCGTHLFDVPEQSDVQSLKSWALQAVQAYREG